MKLAWVDSHDRTVFGVHGLDNPDVLASPHDVMIELISGEVRKCQTNAAALSLVFHDPNENVNVATQGQPASNRVLARYLGLTYPQVKDATLGPGNFESGLQ